MYRLSMLIYYKGVAYKKLSCKVEPQWNSSMYTHTDMLHIRKMAFGIILRKMKQYHRMHIKKDTSIKLIYQLG